MLCEVGAVDVGGDEGEGEGEAENDHWDEREEGKDILRKKQ